MMVLFSSVHKLRLGNVN